MSWGSRTLGGSRAVSLRAGTGYATQTINSYTQNAKATATSTRLRGGKRHGLFWKKKVQVRQCMRDSGKNFQKETILAEIIDLACMNLCLCVWNELHAPLGSHSCHSDSVTLRWPFASSWPRYLKSPHSTRARVQSPASECVSSLHSAPCYPHFLGTLRIWCKNKSLNQLLCSNVWVWGPYLIFFFFLWSMQSMLFCVDEFFLSELSSLIPAGTLMKTLPGLLWGETGDRPPSHYWATAKPRSQWGSSVTRKFLSQHHSLCSRDEHAQLHTCELWTFREVGRNLLDSFADEYR